MLAGRPEASLRQVADAAGVSVATARDVRERLRRGADPLPERVRLNAQRLVEVEENARGELLRLLDGLRRDPTLRFTESGRSLLGMQTMGTEEWGALADSLPEHCVSSVAAVVRHAAEVWQHRADELIKPSRVTA